MKDNKRKLNEKWNKNESKSYIKKHKSMQSLKRSRLNSYKLASSLDLYGVIAFYQYVSGHLDNDTV